MISPKAKLESKLDLLGHFMNGIQLNIRLPPLLTWSQCYWIFSFKIASSIIPENPHKQKCDSSEWLLKITASPGPNIVHISISSVAYYCFPGTTSELSSWQRNSIVCRAKITSYAVFVKKKKYDLCHRDN